MFINNKKLSATIAKNIKFLVTSQNLKLIDLSTKSNVPYSSIAAIASGQRTGVKLINIYHIATALGVTLSQLIGEIPLDDKPVYVPILLWQNIDIHNKTIKFHSEKHISIYTKNKARFFALPIIDDLTDHFYGADILIFQEYDKIRNIYLDDNVALLHSNQTGLIISKIIKDKDIISIKNKNQDLIEVNENNLHIFGIIKETRIYK